MLSCDDYVSAGSVDEALVLAHTRDGRCRFISGGTDLLPSSREMRGGDLHCDTLIDLARIPELHKIRVEGDRLTIGAATTFEDFLRVPELLLYANVLGQCAILVGDDQIRHYATIGGNIVNASPAADGTVALLSLNAEVVIDSWENGNRMQRAVPLNKFVTSPGSTTLAKGEVLSAVRCDALTPDFGMAFRKVGRRRSLIIAVASVSAVVKLTEDRSCFADVRLSVGAVSGVPVRLSECEALLNGKPVSAEIINEAASLARSSVASRTRQQYRKDVIEAFIGSAIKQAMVAAKGEDANA